MPIQAVLASMWAAQAAMVGISPNGSLKAYLCWVVKLAIVIGVPVLILAAVSSILIDLASAILAICWALFQAALCILGIVVVLVLIALCVRRR